LNRAAGGRLFPGLHHAATFRCAEMNSRYEIELRSQDGQTRVSVAARLSQGWPSGSVFRSLDEASAFFRSGNCGWSPVNGSGLEGVELCTKSWAMQSLAVERVESSFFNDRRRFPSGTVEFDCALLMRGIAHEWRALGKFPEPPIPAPRDHRRTTSFFELP
jgi:hypothetical protein